MLRPRGGVDISSPYSNRLRKFLLNIHQPPEDAVLLPQQFFNCLRSSDENVRIVRANLTSAALLFSGKVETNISLAYGLSSPACRRDDLADLNRLGIILSGPPGKTKHDWESMKKRLHAALAAIK